METGRRNITPNQINTLIKNIKKWLVPVSSVSFLMIIIILALGIFAYRAIKLRFIKQKGTEISSIAELKVQQILDFRERGYRTAQLFYENQTFINTVHSLLNNPDKSMEKELNDWLKPLLNYRFFDDITIINLLSGVEIFSAAHDSADMGYIGPDDPELIKTDSIHFGNLELDTVTNRIRLCIYVPLINRTGPDPGKIAVMKFIINPYNNLYNLMQTMPNKGKTGEVLVVRKEGNHVLYLNELRFRKNAALKFRLPLKSKDLPAAQAILGNEEISEGIDYRGKRVLSIARLVPGTDWSVVVKFDVDEIYSELRTMGYLVMALIVLLILASGSGLAVIQGRKQLGIYKSRIDDLNTIHQLSRVYELLFNIEQAIVKNPEKQKLLDDVCQIVVGQKHYLLCWIGMISKNSGYLEPSAQCGIDMQYRENIEVVINEKVKESTDPALKAINSGKHFVSNDIWNDNVLEGWRERALSPQFKSMAVFPLMQRRKTVGALFFYAEKEGNFIENEIKLIDRLCMDLSYALDKIDLEAKEKAAREGLLKNEIVLLENENKLRQQNSELISLNEKYAQANEELKTLNEQLERVNMELENARKDAEESNRLKSTFLANMSHEIRTPMNAIVGFAGLLEKSDMNANTHQEYCQIIIERSNDLMHIISDILDVSKIDSHTVTMYIENISFIKFLDELFLIYENKLEQVGKSFIRLVCMKPQTRDLWFLSTDVLKFRQIFTNLLDNAIKFTEVGEIGFGYHSHDDKNLTCFVSDTGIGIDAREHEKIFEIFTQADHNSQKNYGGTGLGLAICKGNAQLLGGEIHVESEPGKGSIFFFTINYAQGISVPVMQKKLKTKIPVNSWKSKAILLLRMMHTVSNM